MFGRRWRPSKTQRMEYARRMAEAEERYDFIKSDHPIRTGCFVVWVDKASGEVMAGEVTHHSYGASKGQHTFTIALNTGGRKLVKGRNLYDRLIEHEPGDEAKEQKRGA